MDMKQKLQECIVTRTYFATAMSRQAYNDLRGWDLPADENGEDCGFLIENRESVSSNHPDFEGYLSWVPHGEFFPDFHFLDSLLFGHALEYLKKGFLVARKGWNGKGMYICLTPASTVPRGAARSGVVRAIADREGSRLYDGVQINAHIDMRTADGSVCCGWLASQADLLSSDWYVVDPRIAQ